MSKTYHHGEYNHRKSERRENRRKNPFAGLTPVWNRETWAAMNDLAGVPLR